MKIAKKTLSVILSIMMVVSSISICFSTFMVGAATAEDTNDVKALVEAAAAKANAISASGDKWSYENDDGTVWNAVAAVYDYATTYVQKEYGPRTGAKLEDGAPIGTDLLAKYVKQALKVDGDAAAFIDKIINPVGSSLVYYGQSGYVTGEQGGGSFVGVGDYNFAPGDDIQNDSHAPSNYPSLNQVVKTVTVKRTVNSYLLSINSIDDIPDAGFPTTVTYTFTNGVAQKAAFTRSSSWKVWKLSYTELFAILYRWHYLSATNKAESDFNTTAKAEIGGLKTTLTNLMETPVNAFYTKTLQQLTDDRAAAVAAYDALKAKYSVDVINHLIGDVDSYLKNLDTAIKNIKEAADNIRDMLKYIDDGFTPITTANVYDVDINEYTDLYANANNAYTAVKDLPAATIAAVVASDPAFASFTLEACEAFLADLNESISLYSAVQIKADIDMLYADNHDIIHDKYVDEETLSNIGVFLLKDAIVAAKLAFNDLTDTAKATVFGGDSYYELDELVDDIFALCAIRNAEMDYTENFYQYFYPKMTANIGKWKNDKITSLYDEGVEKQAAFEAAYNDYVAALGQDAVDKIFYPVVINGEEMSLADAIEVYLESLKSNIIARNEAQLDKVEEFADLTTVDFTNFSAAKQAVAAFDTDLYTFCAEKGWVTDRYKDIHDNAFAPVEKLVNDFIATGGIPYNKVVHYDGNGVFTIREGGVGHDIARGDGEDYVVNVDKVNTTITKIDDFLTSKEFCSLVGLKDKDGEAYETLSIAIEEVLKQNLFTNEMINTIVGTLFPMVANLLDDKLSDIPGLVSGLAADNPALAEAIVESDDPDSVARINLAKLLAAFNVSLPDGISNVKGTLDVYVNGPHMSKKFVTAFEELGLNIYPSSLAKELGAYPEIAAALADAGTNWNRIVKNEDYIDEDGNLTFDWGVTDYESFKTALGTVLNAILPLVQALLTGKTLEESVEGLATVNGDVGAKVPVIGNISADINDSKATAALIIPGRDLYREMWIPLMEALGVADYANNYAFANLPATADGPAIVAALCDPLMDLIDQLKDAPINKVLEILPNLIYALSMDKVADALKSIVIPINLNLTFNLQIQGALALLGETLSGVLNDNIPAFDIPLDVATLVNGLLSDELGLDLFAMLSDINSLASAILGIVELPLNIPFIDSGKIILASDGVNNASSQRKVITGTTTKQVKGNAVVTGYTYGNANRVKLTPDKAELLYVVLNWVVNAIGDSNFIDGITAIINGGEEPAEDDIVATILEKVRKTVSADTDAALAALIELFVPQKYNVMPMDWLNPDTSIDTDIENFDPSSIPYLKYNNDWTRDKAEYVLTHIDEILESVLGLVGADVTSVNELLQQLLGGLFNNKNFTGLVEALVKLGYLIDNDAVHTIIVDAIGVDLRTWANTYADLFPEIKAEYADVVFKNVPTIGNATAESIDGALVWTVNGTTFVDGDRDTFIDLFTTVCAPFANVISMFFSGKDISLFEDAITILGYDNYKISIGMLFEILGISELGEDVLGEYGHVLTQAEYNAEDPAYAFNFLTKQLFAWIDYMLEGNTIEKVIELIPRFTYFAQSNGISAVIHNLLMPLLVIMDDIRPLIDIDVNTIASTLISDVLDQFVAGVDSDEEIKIELDTDNIINVVLGIGSNGTPVTYNIDLNHFTMTSLIEIVDILVGTDLANSQIVNRGITAVCSQPKKIKGSVIGTAYGSSISTVDALTVFATSAIEALQAESATAGVTNGEALCGFIQKLLNKFVEGDVVDITAVYNVVVNIINGLELKYEDIDWDYMFEGNWEVGEDSTIKTPTQTIDYVDKENNWNKATAEELDKILDDLVKNILDAVLDDGTTLGTLINSLLEDNVYTDANLNAIVELIVGAIAGFDESLRGLVDAALDTNITGENGWFDMVDEDGKCNVAWGVDNAADKKQAFIDGLETILAPANELLSWIFFGDNYRFLTGSKTDENGKYVYNDVITIAGGEGYAYGLVPILEALGCENVKAADEYLVAGKYDVGTAVDDIINSILNRVDDIAGEPASEVLELVPNIIYFLNAGGAKASVNNLLACVTAVVENFSEALGADVTVGTLLEQLIGFNIENLTTANILKLITDNTDLVISDELCTLIETFYIGKLTQFKSANGRFAYRMSFNAAGEKGSRADMITIILSFALDLLEDNEKLFGELLGDTYTVIANILGIKTAKPMHDFEWLYKEYADTDKTFTAIESSDRYSNPYNEYWTKDMAQYIADNFPDFIDNMLCLLGLEVDGVQIKSLNDLLDQVVEGNLYTQDNADKLLELVKGLVAKIDTLEPYGEYIKPILKKAVDVDLTAWDNMTVYVIEGDKVSFANALTKIIEPALPLLKVLLAGEDLKFFYDIDEETDQITIPGSEGYAYGIIPILEALGCDNILTPAEFKSVLSTDEKAAVRAVIDPILNRIDEIEAAPADQILDMLPGVIYFINSKGLDTSLKNMVNSIDTVIMALEPLIGETDFFTLVGVDVSTIDFNYIVNILINFLNDSTGYDLTALAIDAVAELTVGKVVSYESKNGETYYTMKYPTEYAKADMVTVLLRLVIDFGTCEQNRDKVKAILADYITDEQSYNTTCAILDLLADYVSQDPTMSRVLYIVYYIYYGLDKGADGAHDIYHNVNDAWKNIFKKLDNNSNPIVQGISSVLQDALDEYLDGILDSDGIASDGALTFWQKLKAFFQKIADFFKNLFK